MAEAVFNGALREAVREVAPALRYPAIRAVCESSNGRARCQLVGTINNLPLEDVQALGPDLLAAIEKMAPADTMFGVLAIQIALATTHSPAFAVCAACSEVFATNRAPRPDRQTFCSKPECKNECQARYQRRRRRKLRTQRSA